MIHYSSNSLFKVIYILLHCITSLSANPNVINIAGLYPENGGWTAPQMRTIAEYAKDFINNSTTILPNHYLNITWRNSQCTRIISLNNLLGFLQDKDSVYHFILGPACTIGGEPVGDVIPSYNLNMIAYSATSPGLASSTYPNSYLGITTSNNFVVIWAQLLKYFQWRRVALIDQDTGLFNSIGVTFRELLKESNVEFDSERIHDGDDVNDIDTKLDRIFKRKKYKIIIGNFYEGVAYNVLCRAYFKNYIYPHVTWILPAWYTVNWVRNGMASCKFCNGCDIGVATRGALAVDSISTPDETTRENRNTILGHRQRVIWENFEKDNTITDHIVAKFLPYAFDSVVTIALAFNSTISQGFNLSNFNYHSESRFSNNQLMQKALQNSIDELKFDGLTGSVNYDGKARKSSSCELFEFVDDGIVESRLIIPNIERDIRRSISLTNLSLSNVEFKSFGKQNGPLDGVELHILPMSALVICVFLAGCAFAFSILFLIVNIAFRKKKVFKLSSPILNTFILLGACLQCIAAVLVLFDNRLLSLTPEETTLNSVPCTILCHFIWWLPALATDLIFGTLIAKAFRVYMIAIRQSITNHTRVINIVIFILIIMAFDTIYSVLWASFEPIRFQYIADGPFETDNLDITQPGAPFVYIFYCAEGGSPNSPAIAVRFFYIFLRWILCGVGLYFAYQIRKVNIRGVNEFQSITLATLITIFFNLVRIILITMIPSVRLIDPAISLLSISYALDTCLIVSFLFIPKLYYVIKDPNEEKVYHGVHNTTAIDMNSLNELQLVKVKEELSKLKSERDTLAEDLKECRKVSVAFSLDILQTEGPESQPSLPVGNTKTDEVIENKNLL